MGGNVVELPGETSSRAVTVHSFQSISRRFGDRFRPGLPRQLDQSLREFFRSSVPDVQHQSLVLRVAEDLHRSIRHCQGSRAENPKPLVSCHDTGIGKARPTFPAVPHPRIIQAGIRYLSLEHAGPGFGLLAAKAPGTHEGISSSAAWPRYMYSWWSIRARPYGAAAPLPYNRALHLTRRPCRPEAGWPANRGPISRAQGDRATSGGVE